MGLGGRHSGQLVAPELSSLISKEEVVLHWSRSIFAKKERTVAVLQTLTLIQASLMDL